MSEERVIVEIAFQDYEKKAIEWAKDYANDIETIERVVGYSEAYRFCVLDMYKRFVKEKKLSKIDGISKDQYDELLSKIKEIFPEEHDERWCRQVCIFLYFMNFVFETYLV